MPGFVRGITSDQKLFVTAWDDSVFHSEIEAMLGRDLPFVTARALTWIAKDIKDKGSEQIAATYDRPKRWTTNSLFVDPSRKKGGVVTASAVYFKDEAPKGVPAGRYLYPTIKGIARGHKGFEKLLIAKGVMRSDEYALPGKSMKLDAYGNVSAGAIRQILSQLQAGEDWQRETKKSRGTKRSARGARSRRFFAADGTTALPRGIYMRQGAARTIIAAFVFVRQAPRYQVMLAFKEFAEKVYVDRADMWFRKSALELIRRRDGRLAAHYARQYF